ncbi:MAG: alkylhydroperoxidase [Candidatus Hydrogenedentota bacterium]|nr:MAG: alkylhydroperoxidase [Candidatus Hydrogenedentota bacterium]
MDYKAQNKEMVAEYTLVRDRVPDAADAFSALHKATMSDGNLSAKHKELIALAIGISKQCDGCITSHVRGALRHGATLDEIAETVGVSILMNGGPGSVYGGRAMAAAEQFSAK